MALSSSSDTAVRRFSVFFMALAVFGLFGVLAVVFSLTFRGEKNQIDEVNAERRLGIKGGVDADQSKLALPKGTLEHLAPTLLAVKPPAPIVVSPKETIVSDPPEPDANGEETLPVDSPEEPVQEPISEPVKESNSSAHSCFPKI